MTSQSKPPRTSWHDFPDVFIHAGESAVRQHRAYQSAKSGHGLSAIALVNETMSDLQNQRLAELLRGHTPTLVSAHAYEREGVNAIPEAFAIEISKAIGWPHDTGVAQVNVVGHTGADGFSRLARQAEFSGVIEPGCEYVLVDDFVGMGGTLANLKGYIESRGGKALAAVCSTGKPPQDQGCGLSKQFGGLRAQSEERDARGTGTSPRPVQAKAIVIEPCSLSSAVPACADSV